MAVPVIKHGQVPAHFALQSSTDDEKHAFRQVPISDLRMNVFD